MRENIYDLATDILKQRIADAQEELKRQFKGTNPYRKEPVSPKERLLIYSRLTQSDLDFYASNLGTEVVQAYVNDMENLREKYG